MFHGTTLTLDMTVIFCLVTSCHTVMGGQEGGGDGAATEEMFHSSTLSLALFHMID